VTRGSGYWQVLPLVAVDDGGSPYNGLSALAGNPLLLSADRLADEGLLTPADLAPPPLPDDRVDFPAVAAWKGALLRRATEAFHARRAPALAAAFDAYREANAAWLDDYTLFRALRDREGGRVWTEWPEPLRRRDPDALARARERCAGGGAPRLRAVPLRPPVGRRARARRDAGIRVIGDVPIFVAHDSADVWANPDLSTWTRGAAQRRLRRAARLLQRDRPAWGNPLYRLGRDGARRLRLVAGAVPPHPRDGGRGADRPLPRLRGVLGDSGRGADGAPRPLGPRPRVAALRRAGASRSAVSR
jgi:4-alpha-glucanotransferase